jgi:hypothetical protein
MTREGAFVLLRQNNAALASRALSPLVGEGDSEESKSAVG